MLKKLSIGRAAAAIVVAVGGVGVEQSGVGATVAGAVLAAWVAEAGATGLGWIIASAIARAAIDWAVARKTTKAPLGE